MAFTRLSYQETYLVDGQSDLANLPADLPAGSIATTADLSKIWQKDNDGTWKEV